MRCSRCHAENTPGSRYCSSCGQQLPTGPGEPTRRPLTSIDVRRLGRGGAVALGGTVVLLISLFLPWYSLHFYLGGGVTFREGVAAVSGAAGGWRFLIVAFCLGTIFYLAMHTAAGVRVRQLLPHWQMLTLLTAVNLLLAVLAFVARPGGGYVIPGVYVGWAYGAYLGLVAAVVAVAGGILSRQDPDVQATQGSSPPPEATPPAEQREETDREPGDAA